VIGQMAQNVTVDRALEYVAGVPATTPLGEAEERYFAARAA